ncbi:MAG: HAMP domain-containing histidine kinase [Verrucomicrobiae bacterium]|nr:HAMP domain-containing histidine kinase [Verrucomicrobiae bacterium]
MRKTDIPWIATAAAAILAALAVAAAGVMLAREELRVTEKPAGNEVDDAFLETVRIIADLERRWEAALEGHASQVLADGRHGSVPPVAGVVQLSWLNPAFSDPSRDHIRADGGEPAWQPVLQRFSKGAVRNPTEWVIPDSALDEGGGWFEDRGRPPAWRQANGRQAVLCIIDAAEAAAVVTKALQRASPAAAIDGSTGTLEWAGPDGKPWLTTGRSPKDARPDEILRHVSRFGDWTLRHSFPVRNVVRWRQPVLAGAFTLSALLAAGGMVVASAQRKAIRISEERVSFVNRVSHELRTPLTNLLLNTDLAIDLSSCDPPGLRRRLGLIREETARLSRIVDNVLVFARLERGRFHVVPSPCDAEAVVDELRTIFAPLFERKSIVCEYDCRVRGPVPIDRDAFSQVLANLLSNIEKYAGENARARISVEIEGGRLVAIAADNGPGVPATARERIFQPFERAGSGVDEGVSGTGLGLAISNELARRMGGRLDLTESAAGAVFRLSIPLPEQTPS